MPSLSRTFRLSTVTSNSLATLHRSTELGAAEETQNIAVIDKLMKTFRKLRTPCFLDVQLMCMIQGNALTRHTNRWFFVSFYAGCVRV